MLIGDCVVRVRSIAGNTTWYEVRLLSSDKPREADLVVRLALCSVHRNARKGVGVAARSDDAATLEERANPPEKGSCRRVPITQSARGHADDVLRGCTTCCDALD